MKSSFAAAFLRPLPHPLRNERGTALVLALGVLVIMSVLGALVLSATQTESGISGNYRAAQQAFHAADRAVEYAMTDEAIYSVVSPSNPLFSLKELSAEKIADAGTKSGISDGEVLYLNSGSLPPGSGSDPTYFQSRYYIIDVTGQGPGNSSTRIEAQVSRIVPK